MEIKKKIAKKESIAKSLRSTFAFLAVGFTGISAINGLHFYEVIFGLQMAVLITSVFEIARLACLFRFVNGRRTDFLSVIIYMAVASTCAFASVNSFSSRIIRQNFAEEKEQGEQIHRIKQAYSETMEKRIEERRRDIRYIENVIAKNPSRDRRDSYWNRRLSQIKANYHDLITERDRFLNANPENPEHWIQAKASMLDVEVEPLSEESGEIRSVTQALKQLWGLKKSTAQKMVGVILTLTVELSILLLAFLSSADKPKNVTEKSRKTTARDKILKSLRSDFGEKPVRKFLSVSRDYYSRTGRLPPLRRLTPNLRKVRRALEELDQEQLEKIFEKNRKRYQ